MGFLARWRWRKLGYGRWGMSCLLLPDSSSDHCQHPLIQSESEVPGGKLRLALKAMRTVHRLLKRAA